MNPDREPRKLVLFDIDGTLLYTDGAGRRALRRALLERFGPAGPIESVRFDGKTDPEIVRELLRARQHPAQFDHEVIFRICGEYVSLLQQELEGGKREVRVLPGVIDLLNRLRARHDVVIGLLTGNVEPGAKLKLRHAGLDETAFVVGAYGSDAVDRAELPPIACARAEVVMGRVPHGSDVVIIGDTPADVTCGERVSARALAVATGSYSQAQLTAAGAWAVFADLGDTDAVEAAILE